MNALYLFDFNDKIKLLLIKCPVAVALQIKKTSDVIFVCLLYMFVIGQTRIVSVILLTRLKKADCI